MTCTSSSSVTTPSTSRPTKRGAPHHVAAADVGERLHLADLYEHCFPPVPAHRDSAPQKLASTLDAARPPQRAPPITSPSSFAKTAAITCTSSVTITAYRCTRRARFIREHPTCPSTSSRGIARRHLAGSPNVKGPSPRCCHPSEDPRKTKMDEDDETRRYCVFRIPFASKLFFGSYPESCRFWIYMAWSLLPTPPVPTTGDAATLPCAFIAWR